MTTAARYATYRPSKDRWLGDIPAHWGTPAIGHLVRIRNGSDYKHVETEDEIGFPVIGSGGPFARSTEFMYDRETVLLGRKGTIDRPLYWDGPFWAVDTMFYTEIGPDLDPKFFYYFATRIDFGFYSTNTALPSMSGSDIRAIRVPLPPLDEQRQIAEYLDRETGNIDELITKQEQLVATLTERRQATITRAVTQGTQPDSELRESGVDWLGKIPKSWAVKRLKYLGTTHIGLTFDPSEVVDESDGTLVLRSGNVQSSKISLEDRLCVSTPIPAHLVLMPGDILICARNGSRALIGKSALISDAEAGSTFGAFMSVLRSPISDYLYWVMNSSIFKHQMGSFVTATINQLTNGTLNNFEIPVPPRVEQIKVAEYLAEGAEKFDRLKQTCELAIFVLRERRAALISAAVTGKIDVRGL